jgi:hypothetical protein
VKYLTPQGDYRAAELMSRRAPPNGEFKEGVAKKTTHCPYPKRRAEYSGDWESRKDAWRCTKKPRHTGVEKSPGPLGQRSGCASAHVRSRTPTQLGLQLLTECGRYSLLPAAIVFERDLVTALRRSRAAAGMTSKLLRRREQSSAAEGNLPDNERTVARSSGRRL